MKCKLLSTTLLSAAMLCSNAHADGHGKSASDSFYVTVLGGWATALDPDDARSGGITAAASGDAGWIAGIAAGKDLGEWRIEGEFSYRNTDLDVTFSGGGPTETGETEQQVLSFMANGYYDHEMGDSGFTPFVGLGIGLAKVETDDLSTATYTATGNDETEAAYQAMAGLNYQVQNNVSVGTSYRFFNTFDNDNYGGSHEILGSVTFGF